jgi:hypothetical protein
MVSEAAHQFELERVVVLAVRLHDRGRQEAATATSATSATSATAVATITYAYAAVATITYAYAAVADARPVADAYATVADA